MHTQHILFPLPQLAQQRYEELLREAEHVRLLRSLKPQRNSLARRLAQALNKVVMLAHVQPPFRDLEAA